MEKYTIEPVRISLGSISNQGLSAGSPRLHSFVRNFTIVRGLRFRGVVIDAQQKTYQEAFSQFRLRCGYLAGVSAELSAVGVYFLCSNCLLCRQHFTFFYFAFYLILILCGLGRFRGDTVAGPVFSLIPTATQKPQ